MFVVQAAETAPAGLPAGWALAEAVLPRGM